MFEKSENINIKILNYINDIAIIIIKDNAKNNYELFKITALKLMQWGQNNAISFDFEKIEFIYFQNKK